MVFVRTCEKNSFTPSRGIYLLWPVQYPYMSFVIIITKVMNQVKGYNTDHNTLPPLLLYTLHWLRNLPTNGCGFVWMHENFLHTFPWDLSEAMRVVGCINNVRKKQAYIFTALQVSVSPRRDTIGHQQLGEWTGRQESMRASVASTLLQVCSYLICDKYYIVSCFM